MYLNQLQSFHIYKLDLIRNSIKKIKYLRINLTRNVLGLYKKKIFKSSLKDTKDDLNKEIHTIFLNENI